MKDEFFSDREQEEPGPRSRPARDDYRGDRSNRSDDDRRRRPTTRGNAQNRKEAKEQVKLHRRAPNPNATHWVPYVLIGLAVFLGLCLLMNLFCNWGNKLAGDPGAHWMGYIGYYICYGLFGMFGPAAFLVPILLGILGVFWKQYEQEKITVEKSIASGLLLLSLSSLIHVFCLAILPAQQRDIPVKVLISNGAQMRGGGFIGGEIGFFFIRYLSIAGAIITGSFLFLLVSFFFLGMTPSHLLSYLRSKKNLHVDRRSLPDTSDMEEAWKQMGKKHSRAQDPSKTLEPVNEKGLPPAGAVRPAKGKTAEAEEKEELAPIPMPLLNTVDSPNEKDSSDELFIPEGLEHCRGFETHDRPAKSPVEKALAMEAQYYRKKKKPLVEEPVEEAPAEVQYTEPVLQEEDRADWVFPRTNDAKKMNRTQKEDRDFELKKIFIELDDLEEEDGGKKHTDLPPEVPIPDGAFEHDLHRSEEEPEEQDWIFSKSEVRKPLDAWMDDKTEPVVSEAERTVDLEEQAPAKVTVGPAARPTVERTVVSPSSAKDEGTDVFVPAAPKAKAPQPSKTVEKPAEPAPEPYRNYQFPPISYLHPGEPITEENQSEIRENINKLQTVLNDFRIGVSNITYSYGPTLTRYEVFPAPGVRVRTVVNLADDIALCFARSGVRMEAPIPGMSAIGVEVPNDTRCTVYLRDLLESEAFRNNPSKLTAGLGVDVTGKPLLFDVSKMPHLLVAGATGMGKSVCINCIIMSLLYKAKPDEVKLVLIDPKKVEFSLYKGIPHLLAPIVTSPKDATGALQAAVEEMEKRFELIEEVGVHDIKGYNEATKNDPDMPFLPHIVIIIDELADLMMTARDEVETAICRLAQKARAAGMHIIVGTQRPSVDVVTGLIKSNIPSRIACTVASQVDSRTILDIGGAEKLIGKGDMLFAPVGCMKPARLQGAFVSDKEVEKICDFIRSNNGTAVYDEHFTKKMKEFSNMCGKKGKDADLGGFAGGGDGADGDGDPKYLDALRVAIEEKRVATSLLQRKLGVGYSRAAKLIDRMEAEGFVSKPDGTKPRNVLISQEQFMELFMRDGFSEGQEEDEF